MKRGSTLFLKIVLVLIGLMVLGACGYILPEALSNEKVGQYRPIIIGMCIAAIPFFIGLYQAWKLLDLIDKNNAFSNLSIQALKIIKYCALIICGFYALGLPFIFYVAEKDDAPGVIVIGLVIVFSSFVLSVFATLLQRLLQNALDIKSENDLTV